MDEIIFEGKHLHLCRAANGWEYVHRSKASQGVTMMATTIENKLVLVEQHRTPLARRTIELPVGLVEGPRAGGRREVISSTTWRSLT